MKPLVLAVLAILASACSAPDGLPPDLTCHSMTCHDIDAACGRQPDGCGGFLECGSCGPNGTCNAQTAQCDPKSSCTPTTCDAEGAECGSISDGCSSTLQCGSCGPDACNANHLCECAPSCGTHECGSDGCGGSCGSCASNESCSTSGQCVPQGNHTTPPAAWVCNPTYWDAADGCDCNCGALDPDCGITGQQLLGCTGLSAPTCNAMGKCTGGGVCNSTPTGPYLTLFLVNTAAPVQSGGTILAGRWEANDTREYGGASGNVGGNGYAVEITGSTWNMVTRKVGGFPNVDENFTASISGNTVTLTRTCPSTATVTMTFTATATSLKLSKTSGGTTTVTTYSKKW
jgi:hypothetical protein